MPTTSSAGLRYPAGTDATTIATYFQNLANDVDQKVVIRVTDNTARNALTKFDQMLVQVTSTRRTFRYDSTNSRWDLVAGPWFSWTPTLVDGGGVAVTGASSTIGEYTIIDGKFWFRTDLKFGATIDGRVGQLLLQLPAGVVGRNTAGSGSQGGATCQLYTAASNFTWLGKGHLAPGASTVTLMFPPNSTTVYLSNFVNATSVGATGTGTPLVASSYPLTTNSEFGCWGQFALSAWPTL